MTGLNLDALNEDIETVGEDFTEAQKGGGGTREIPAEGLAMARLISYVELGKQVTKFKGEEKIKDRVWLEFELYGKNYPATNSETGREKPLTVSFEETLSRNERANFFKLFTKMNHDGTAKHMAQLLGKPFLLNVIHVTKGEGDDKRTYVNVRNAEGYTIRPPYTDTIDDEGNAIRKVVSVPPAVAPLRAFVWNSARKDQWDSIFIDGRYPDKKDEQGNIIREGGSKNWLQERIRAATNFPGSPIANLIGGADQLDLGEVEKPKRTEAPKEAPADNYDPTDDIPF